MIWKYQHSPTEEHLGCFQFEAVVNKASMNICVKVFCVNIHFHFSEISAQDIAVSYSSYMVRFIRNCQTLFESSVPYYIPTSNV